MRYIYLLRTLQDDRFIYKIGFTKSSIEKRIKQLLTGTINEIEIVKYVQVDKYWNSIEKNLHRKYKHKNISREWFDLSDIDISSFESDILLYYNNIKYIESTSTLGNLDFK